MITMLIGLILIIGLFCFLGSRESGLAGGSFYSPAAFPAAIGEIGVRALIDQVTINAKAVSMNHERQAEEILADLNRDSCPHCGEKNTAILFYGLPDVNNPLFRWLVAKKLVVLKGWDMALEDRLCQQCGCVWVSPEQENELIQFESKKILIERLSTMNEKAKIISSSDWSTHDPESLLELKDQGHTCKRCDECVPLKYTRWSNKYGSVCFKCLAEIRKGQNVLD